MKEVQRAFLPELLNRLDDVIIFGTLAPAQLREIADRLAERDITLALTDAAADAVLAAAYSPVYGARPLRRWLERHVATSLSLQLIEGSLAEHSDVVVDLDHAKYTGSRRSGGGMGGLHGDDDVPLRFGVTVRSAPGTASP